MSEKRNAGEQKREQFIDGRIHHKLLEASPAIHWRVQAVKILPGNATRTSSRKSQAGDGMPAISQSCGRAVAWMIPGLVATPRTGLAKRSVWLTVPLSVAGVTRRGPVDGSDVGLGHWVRELDRKRPAQTFGK
jgi:hypothetical protein